MSSAFSGDETAPFFGFLGAAAALIFSCMGAAYGTAKSGVGVASMGVMRPELVMKLIVPVVMAGVFGIYGLRWGTGDLGSADKLAKDEPEFDRESLKDQLRGTRGFRNRGASLYPMDGRRCQETLRPAQPPRIRLGFSHQL